MKIACQVDMLSPVLLILRVCTFFQEAEEQKRLEEERRLLEEKEEREQEEYEKMKSAFVVEDSGFDQTNPEEEKGLLKEFVEHIKVNCSCLSFKL